MDYDWFVYLFGDARDERNEFVRLNYTFESEPQVATEELHDKFYIPCKIKLKDVAARFREYIYARGYVLERFELVCCQCEVIFWDVTSEIEVKYRLYWWY